jgi:hypothetical protein
MGDGIQLRPLGTAAINSPIVPATGDYDDGEIGGIIGRRNRSTQRKPARVPLCPPWTPHASRIWTRVAAVGSQRLTAWATARPIYCPSTVSSRSFVLSELLMQRCSCRVPDIHVSCAVPLLHGRSSFCGRQLMSFGSHNFSGSVPSAFGGALRLDAGPCTASSVLQKISLRLRH